MASGEIININGWRARVAPCHVCGGRGSCRTCQGTGTVYACEPGAPCGDADCALCAEACAAAIAFVRALWGVA